MNSRVELLEILGLGASASDENVRDAYADLLRVWSPENLGSDPRLRERAREELARLERAHAKLTSSTDAEAEGEAEPVSPRETVVEKPTAKRPAFPLDRKDEVGPKREEPAEGLEKRLPKESCPRCGSALARRVGKYGPFLGCTTFPACRYTRDAETGSGKARDSGGRRFQGQGAAPATASSGPTASGKKPNRMGCILLILGLLFLAWVAKCAEVTTAPPRGTGSAVELR